MGMDFSYTPKAKTDFNRSIYDIDKSQKIVQCSVILTVDEKFKSNKVFAKSLSGTATLQSPIHNLNNVTILKPVFLTEQNH